MARLHVFESGSDSPAVSRRVRIEVVSPHLDALIDTNANADPRDNIGCLEAPKLNSLRGFPYRQGFRFALWAPIPLRLIVGFGFMQHGFAKLGKGPDAFAAILQALHVPMPHLMAWATILTEILGGFAVLLGAFVWLVSLPMTAVLLVAVFTVQLQHGFGSIKLLGVTPAGAQFGPPGYETNLLYIACLAALVMAGPGPFAVDGLRRDPVRSSRLR